MTQNKESELREAIAYKKLVGKILGIIDEYHRLPNCKTFGMGMSDIGTAEDELWELFPCTSCGINADPADGFGYCTCGNEKRRIAVAAHTKKAVLEARKDERSKVIDEAMGHVMKMKFGEQH